MKIIRNEALIARRKKIGQWASLIGMLFLLGGMVLLFVLEDENLIIYQTFALVIGWLVSQVGIYLSHRYVRTPRPDIVLDEALAKVARNGRIYHYILPAPHVLLTPNGIIVFNLKFQGGKITVEGDKWKQKGIGFRRFFGQEGLGNPSSEVETMVQQTAAFINKKAPSIEEVPIAAMIVFTTKGLDELDLDGSSIPAMHFTKVKGYIRQKGQKEKLPQSDYDALQAAFDEAGSDWL